jgi:serine/threonine-protein kinase
MKDEGAAFYHPEPGAPLDGYRVGPYALMEEVGRGGMGRVFRARRADGQFTQEVALKLLDIGVPSPEARARFLAERQILATLNHPHIARLLDGGVTEADQPYFVMEMVDGPSLGTYCDTHRCSLRERLALMLDVCDAVQHAHRMLVVHRDLKPSNILVTAAGTVKLLDFGIAKLLDPAPTHSGTTPRTRTGLLPMTPRYASPEQVLGTTITTASDIYQLGVILYELLTGRLPYCIEGRSPGDVERIICRDDPARPSTAVTQPPRSAHEPSPEQVRRCRQTSQVQLHHTLQGDLDTILMKALRKKPERRYEAVDQLAEDLRRFLEGRPVSAHPDTWAYRSSKFARRHRQGVAVIVAFLVLLIGYGVTSTWYAQRTRAALYRAQQEARQSERAINFLVDLFEQADPYQAVGSNRLVGDSRANRALLDRGVARARRALSHQPDVQATMLYTLGRIYRNLGDYDEAASLLEDALALQRKHLPVAHPDRAKSLHELARLRRHQGELATSAQLYRTALTIQRNHLGDEHPTVAENIRELGIIAARGGQYMRADSLFREALAMQESLHGPGHPQVATELHALGLLHMLKEDLPTAERLLRRSLAIRQRHADAAPPDVAETLDRLGQVLLMRGKIDAAEPLLRDARAIREKLFQAIHPSRAVSLNNMGRLLRQKGDVAAADTLHQEAQAIYQKLYGPVNTDVATTLRARAQVYRAQEKYAAAERMYWRAVVMQWSLHGSKNRHAARDLDELATLYEVLDAPGKAGALRALLVASAPAR